MSGDWSGGGVAQGSEDASERRTGRGAHSPKGTLAVVKDHEGECGGHRVKSEHSDTAVIVVPRRWREAERQRAMIVRPPCRRNHTPAQCAEHSMEGELADSHGAGKSNCVETGTGEGNAHEHCKGDGNGHDRQRRNRATSERVRRCCGDGCPDSGKEAAKGTRASTVHAPRIRATPNRCLHTVTASAVGSG
jgi:hypothetical protein